MAHTETTTSATCQAPECTAEQEQGIRLLRFEGAERRLCVAHAVDLYDLEDPIRRGGRVELFDLA